MAVAMGPLRRRRRGQMPSRAWIRVPFINGSPTQELVVGPRRPKLADQSQPTCVLHALSDTKTRFAEFNFEDVERVSLGYVAKNPNSAKGAPPLIGSCPPFAVDVYVSHTAQFYYRTLTIQLPVAAHSQTVIIPLEREYLRLISQFACISGQGAFVRGPAYLFSHFRPRQLTYDDHDGAPRIGSARVFLPTTKKGALAMGYDNAADLSSSRFPILNKLLTEDSEFCSTNHIHPEVYLHIKQQLLCDPLREWFGLLDIVSMNPALNNTNLWEAKMLLAHFLDSRWCVGEELIRVHQTPL